MAQPEARLLIDELPDVDQRPEEYLPRDRTVDGAPSRRTVLKGTMAVVAGAALGALDLLPFSRPAAAHAYTEWTTCVGYYSSSTICVPSSAYYGSDNCLTSWHKNQYDLVNTCILAEYEINLTSCSGRNAWRWGSTKCSDGWKYSRDLCNGGSTVINNFSICRSQV